MLSETLPFDFIYSTARTTIIEEGRNMLITEDENNQAIKQKLNPIFTHWLFVDHDCGFIPEHIENLLRHDKDIVSGAYRPKDRPERFVAGYCDDHGKIMDYVKADDVGLISVDWAGGGFLLCKREALEKMDYPYWWKGLHRYGNRIMTVGDDVYFCLNARNNLIQIFMDTSTILNHESNRYASISNSVVKTGRHSSDQPTSAGWTSCPGAGKTSDGGTGDTGCLLSGFSKADPAFGGVSAMLDAHVDDTSYTGQHFSGEFQPVRSGKPDTRIFIDQRSSSGQLDEMSKSVSSVERTDPN
jgi:hypothetical protein